MLGNFKYYNPTKIYFGQESLKYLSRELEKYGEKVLLIYGQGSIKANGIYDDVMKILNDSKKKVIEVSGVMPNPTAEKLLEGARIAGENRVDFILAVGGGSVCDYAKAVSAAASCDEDPWEKFFVRGERFSGKAIPIGSVLTMVGTGSEMNTNSVITHTEQKRKLGHTFGDDFYPKFSILNPEYTLSIPRYQMVSGFFDIMSHILEQYFSGTDDNTSDYLAEGLLKSLINSTVEAVKNPQNYEARSNIMWTASLALNTLISMGKSTDWMVHRLGQAIGAYTDATHGMTLSAVALPYYKKIMPYGLAKFKRFAINVWDVKPEGKTDEEVAESGLAAMRDWMTEMGVVMNIKDLGVKEDMIEEIAGSIAVLKGGYKVLTKEDMIEIFTEAYRG